MFSNAPSIKDEVDLHGKDVQERDREKERKTHMP